MAWTAIAQAFRSSHIESVVAGADIPNAASFAVMRRLGMRFYKSVEYPLGPGAEYVLHRGDAAPEPPPALIAVE
jgi:RimJ/RimL family protein N-acetyltransferase